MSKISIIIPVFNEEKTIQRCLEQFIEQTDKEVIVVDGGSTDSTLELIKKFPKVRLLESITCGRGQQLNYGAAFATGDWLLFLHADTILPKVWQQEIANAASLSKTAGCFRMAYGKNENLSWWQRLIAKIANIRSYLSRYPYGDQAMFFTNIIFQKLGGFKDIPLMEDYEFSRRYYHQVGKFYCSHKKVISSLRRFKSNPIKYAMIMRLFPLLFDLGVPTRWLVKFYQNIR